MPQFWVIAIGFIFVALKFTINGVELLLPTCFGYAMIGFACWSLRDDQRAFRFAPWVAVVLAAVTFPDMFRAAAGGIPWYEEWMLWPRLMLETSLVAMVAVGVWREADLRDLESLRTAAIGTAPFVVISLVAWWYFPVWSPTTLLISALLEGAPAFYLAAVCALAAKQFA